MGILIATAKMSMAASRGIKAIQKGDEAGFWSEYERIINLALKVQDDHIDCHRYELEAQLQRAWIENAQLGSNIRAWIMALRDHRWRDPLFRQKYLRLAPEDGWWLWRPEHGDQSHRIVYEPPN